LNSVSYKYEWYPVEKAKIKYARKIFDEINHKIDPKKVKYDVVDGYGKLMDIVGVQAAK